MWKKIKKFVAPVIGIFTFIAGIFIGRGNANRRRIRRAHDRAKQLESGIKDSTDAAESITRGITDLKGPAETAGRAAQSISDARIELKGAYNSVNRAKAILERAKKRSESELGSGNDVQ